MVSLDATELEPVQVEKEPELAQGEKEPAQALAAREKAVVERVPREKAMARAPVLALGSRVGWEGREEVQETNVQAPAPALVEGSDAGMGTGWVAVEPQVLLGLKTKQGLVRRSEWLRMWEAW